MTDRQYQFSLYLNEWNEKHQWITIQDICETENMSLDEAKQLYSELRNFLLERMKK